MTTHLPGWCLLAALAGCGSVTADPIDGPIDTPPPPPGACNLDLPFGAPEKIEALSSEKNDDHVTLTADETQAIFQTNRDTSIYNLYSAVRVTASGRFALPTTSQTMKLNGALSVYHPALSSNGLLIVFSHNLKELQFATRASLQEPFGDPDGVSFPDGGPDAPTMIQHPFLTANGHLYFSMTDASAGSAPRIYRAGSLATIGHFGSPIQQGLGVSDEDLSPVVTNDERVMYFERPIGGNYEIMIATRAGTDWGAPTRVEELNTPQIDAPSWLSPDGCRLYFSSARQPQPTNQSYDFYVAARPQ